MIKNGKYFVPAQKNGEDFKELFKRLAHAGAGRPVDANGVAIGPWTPDSLADAIARIDGSEAGIDVRTVQLWFQDNDSGIGADNVGRLARIFGCGDREATSAWQAELAASQERLRSRRKRAPAVDAEDAASEIAAEQPTVAGSRKSLALLSEAVFGRGALLNLPIVVFAGAGCLNFAAYLIGIDSITYLREDGVTKQIGFHWATNWTFLFLIFLPLFFAFAVDLLTFWKADGRSAVLTRTNRIGLEESWPHKVERYSATYWATFVLCLPFAGLLQWVGTRLIPLMRGADGDDIDWGSVALVRPDVIGPAEAAVFTGIAYLYMAVCFYLMVVGLILLFTLAHDFWEMTRRKPRGEAPHPQVAEIGTRILRGIFRCTAAGILVAICMKVQNVYLTTDAGNIWAWLFADVGLIASEAGATGYAFTMHWTSILILMPTCFLFLYAFVRHGIFHTPSFRMIAAFGLILTSYLLIGAFPGFSMLLALALLVALYGIIDPMFGAGGASFSKETPGVP